MTSRSDLAQQHPRVEDLMEHASGKLDASTAEALLEHLAVCTECAETVLEARRFEPGKRDLEVTTEQRSTALRRFELALGAESAPASEPAADLVETPRPERRAGEPMAGARAPGWLLAAVLALAAAAGIWAVLTQRALSRARVEIATLESEVAEARQPTLEVATVNLLPADFVRGDAEAHKVPAGHELIVTMHLAEPPGSGLYRCEIVAANGERLWSSDDLRPTAEATFRVGLPGGFLPSGRYELRLTSADQPALTLGLYTLEIMGS